MNRIDAMTNKLLRDPKKRLPAANGMQGGYTDYRDYISNAPEVQRLHAMVTREYKIAPCVAAYALLSTDCAGIDQAVHFIFELEDVDGSNNMQHPFVPYLPYEPPV